VSDRQATWDCPACDSPNAPGTDSCQVCGRHLHVEESTGAVGSRNVEATGWGELAWGLAGVAASFVAVALGIVIWGLVNSVAGFAAFAAVHLVLVSDRVRRHRSFFIGWGSGFAIGVFLLYPSMVWQAL
jgi:hypothetical protein